MNLENRFWPNSFHAHRLLMYARSIDFKNMEEFNQRIFSATYEEGENISSIDFLVQLADELGLKGAKKMLYSNDFKQEVLEEDDFAKTDLEIK